MTDDKTTGVQIDNVLSELKAIEPFARGMNVERIGSAIGVIEYLRDTTTSQSARISELERERDEARDGERINGATNEVKRKLISEICDMVGCKRDFSCNPIKSVRALLARAESAERRAAEAEAVVGKLPRFKDGPPAIPSISYGWSPPFDELQKDGSIYHSKPSKWLAGSRQDLYSTQEAASAVPPVFEPKVWSDDDLIPDDHWCDACGDSYELCAKCKEMWEQANKRAKELNARSGELVAEYAARASLESGDDHE